MYACHVTLFLNICVEACEVYISNESGNLQAEELLDMSEKCQLLQDLITKATQYLSKYSLKSALRVSWMF